MTHLSIWVFSIEITYFTFESYINFRQFQYDINIIYLHFFSSSITCNIWHLWIYSVLLNPPFNYKLKDSISYLFFVIHWLVDWFKFGSNLIIDTIELYSFRWYGISFKFGLVQSRDIRELSSYMMPQSVCTVCGRRLHFRT